MIQGLDGNLYGTAASDGALGYGTVFKMTPSGLLSVLHVFGYTDGAYPAGGLLLGADGSLYGTTEGGGSDSCYQGCGTVFKITARGVFTTLHSFISTDGATPLSRLIQGGDGNLYGTTYAGGADDSCTTLFFVGCGTVFKLSPAGALATLHNFAGNDGANPEGALLQGTDGNLYGTTSAGGANTNCKSGGAIGCGTVFQLSPAGMLTTLHNFSGNDGAHPRAALLAVGNTTFYGTTFDGAMSGGAYCAGGLSNGTCGTVFKATWAGGFATIHRFDGLDGGNPNGELNLGTDGNLYGTTVLGGGGEYYGTVFMITPSGTLATLHSFSGFSDGGDPFGGLVQSTNGIFYGTTAEYGTYGYGTVFSESVGLSPFIITVPTARKIGQQAIILGTNLSGATSVTFNGTVATFKVVSATEITTTVPVGATTGTVQVVTPGGTLSSNVPFRVLH